VRIDGELMEIWPNEVCDNGDLENKIFMKILPGVEVKEEEVWLLHKALYGLKQASREWYLKLKEQLEELCYDLEK